MTSHWRTSAEVPAPSWQKREREKQQQRVLGSSLCTIIISLFNSLFIFTYSHLKGPAEGHYLRGGQRIHLFSINVFDVDRRWLFLAGYDLLTWRCGREGCSSLVPRVKKIKDFWKVFARMSAECTVFGWLWQDVRWAGAMNFLCGGKDKKNLWYSLKRAILRRQAKGGSCSRELILLYIDIFMRLE